MFVNSNITDKTDEVRRLGMGRLLGDLSQTMQNKVQRGSVGDPLKIRVHSTHDTALAALCNTLDVFDEKCECNLVHCDVMLMKRYVPRWPAFTSAITFELFKKKDETRQRSLFEILLSPFWSRETSEHCDYSPMAS